MTAPDPAAWLAAGKALEAAASPGPWVVEVPQDSGYAYVTFSGYEVAVDFDATTGDAQWTADARTRLPAALGALEAVLELHRDRLAVGICEECDHHFPCLTVRTITAAIEKGQP